MEGTIMTKHADMPADCNDGVVILAELNEAELSTATGGTSGGGEGKVTFNPIVIIKVIDKSAPHIFL
jgi:type VI protein secretion system component Hcp